MEVRISDEDNALLKEMGALHNKMERLGVTDMLKRMEVLKKHFSSKANEYDAGKEVVFKSKEGTVLVTYSKAKSVVEMASNEEIIKAKGLDFFKSIASVSVTNAKKYLNQNELDKLSTVGVGSRSLKAVTLI